MSGTSFAAAGAMLVLAAVATGCAGQSPAAPTTLIGDRHVGSAGVESAAPIALTSAATTDSTQTRAAITFTLSGCPNLPVGLTVFGSGDDFLVVNSRVDADGVTHMERNDLATGTATDSNDASYKFSYHNHSNITIPPGGFPWSFTTTDHFNLVGSGQANQLQVHFVARVTFTSPADPPLIEFVNSFGNPFFCDAL
jgi:hypothetical protein